MPVWGVINISNVLGLMRPRALIGGLFCLARFPLDNSHTVIKPGHWELKMMQHEVENMDVSLISGDDGFDRIAIKLLSAMAGELGTSLTLSPSQARILATELIAAVNRAEVKSSLKTSPNMWRRQGEARTRLATAG
jgi:hypothetical protein